MEALPWGIKVQLTHEKAAIGFYLSGHLFDESVGEVRRFVRRPLEAAQDSRDPQTFAGIVTDFRVINGQRGKLALFKLDDKTAVVEAAADEAVLNACKGLLKEDELLIISGKLQRDRFSGGMRLNVQQVWDLPTARCRFGRFLRVVVGAQAPDAGDVARLVRDFPPRREVLEEGGETLQFGLEVRLALQCTAPQGRAAVELSLGEKGRIYPTDAALASWLAQAEQGQATIVYDPDA